VVLKRDFLLSNTARSCRNKPHGSRHTAERRYGNREQSRCHGLYFHCKVGGQENVWARESAAARVPGLWQAVDKESEWIADLGQKFPKISEASWKDGTFVAARLHQQFADQH
jgi:hypothetical protein